MEQPTTRDFLIHLTQGNYQAAIDLADELQLEKELVYKAQWTKCKETAKIQHKQVELLKLVKDDAWVSGECLSTLVDDGALQKEILILGQQRTNTVTAPLLASTAALDTKAKVWLRTRFYFIQYLDRLETFIKIWPSIAHPDTPFSKAYDQFRDCNLVAQAIEYARLERHHALDALFMHHGKETLPYRLFILSQIPETANPDRFVLPHVTQQHEDKWLEEPWRNTQDAVESDEIQKQIHLDVPNYDEYVKRLEEKIQATEYPTSSKVVADWYMNRAKAVDSIGLGSNALEMSRYAQVMGVTGIESQVTEYEWLCKYVYVSRPVQSIEDVVTLERFQNMSNEVILQGLLSNTTDIVSDMMGLALPWVQVCKKQRMSNQANKDEKPEMMVYRWLLDQMDHLDLCCVVFEKSKPTEAAEDRIIKDDLDLSRLILSITYLSQGPLEYLVRMFECLPIFSDLEEDKESTDPTDIRVFLDSSGKDDTPIGLFKALEPVGAYGLTQMIDTLQNHLGSAEVLHRYHVDIPPRWYLEEQSIESQRQLCTRMSSQAAGGVESGGAQFDRDDDWRELLDDMVRLHDNGQGIFGKLDQTEILEIFFSSLLRCGRFKLAKDLILGTTKLLDINKAEQILIDSEREFFDNATSGNMHAGSMKQAWECLQVLPETEEIKKEKDLINATHALIYEYKVQDRPGITLMPIQIRQSKDRLDLISKLIHARRDIYKRHEKVLDLVGKLGYAQNDLLSKVKTMSMLSSAALVNEDYLESYRLCQITVEMAQNKVSGKNKSYNDEIDQAAWKICFNLGKLDSFEDIPRRLDSLSMAMSICPVEHIRDVLVVWRKLEKSTNQIDLLMQLDAANGQYSDKMMNDSKGWQGLLQNATKPWNFGELLSGGENADRGGGKRKRDIVRNVFDGLLSFNNK